MVKFTKVQAAHTFGVLDPHMAERRDTKFVPGSLSDAANIVMLPTGGYIDRGGTVDFGRARRIIAPVAWTVPMAALPNGGSAADLLAGLVITTGAAAGARFVLASINFGAPQRLHFIDISAAAATAGGDGALIAEYWDGAAWQTFGSNLLLTTRSRGRRFASGAPGHAGLLASQFRVAVDGTIASGAMSFSGLRFHAETAAASDVVQKRHSPRKGLPAMVEFTDFNADIFVSGVFQASVAHEASGAQLRQMKAEIKFDTLLAFHQELAPRAFTMLGDPGEWASDPVAFENVPLVDYGGDYVNGVNEVQNITLYTFVAGDAFELLCEGEATTQIVRNAAGVTTAADIKAALEALPNVEPGLTVTAVSADSFEVTFTGVGNAATDWLTMTGTALNAGGFVRVRTVTHGKRAGEMIISAARGFPAVGRFAGQRLLMAGLKSRPTDELATMTGSETDLNTEIGLATAAFSYEVEGPANNEIRDIYVGRTPIFFGDEQISYLRNNTLSASEAPQFGSADAPGIDEKTGLVTSDNAIFYMQKGGNTLRMLSYTELEQNYVGDNASVLSAHLIKGVISITRRRAVGAVDSDLLIMVNQDGTLTALTMMRTQEVSGFAPWTTDGAFIDACVDHDNNLWLMTRRGLPGAQEIRREKAAPFGLLDEAVTRSFAGPATEVPGLPQFNGRKVWLINDNNIIGPLDVEAGRAALPSPLSGQVTIGTWTPPFATDQDVRLEDEQGRRFARLKRVCRAEIAVIGTTSLALSANDSPAFNMPLRRLDEVIFDEGPLASPVTGRIEAEGMHGFTRHGRLTVTQLFPGKLTVASVSKDVAA